jgi:hypothetical protein
MKNLLLIAFATLALCLGANIANACPNCEGKTVVKADKKAEKVETKDADADKAAADTAEAKTATKASSGSCKRASAGQLVKADRDASGACGKSAGCGGGCGSGCGGGCGGGCGDGGCDTAKATKTVKN